MTFLKNPFSKRISRLLCFYDWFPFRSFLDSSTAFSFLDFWISSLYAFLKNARKSAVYLNFMSSCYSRDYSEFKLLSFWACLRDFLKRPSLILRKVSSKSDQLLFQVSGGFDGGKFEGLLGRALGGLSFGFKGVGIELEERDSFLGSESSDTSEVIEP